MSECRVPIRPQVVDLPRYAPGKSAPGAVKISSNEIPDAPSQAVIDQMARHLNTVNRYPDLTAAPVRNALAGRLGVNADQICVGTGSSALLIAALTAVCEPGAKVVYPWRSFESYPIAIPACHGQAAPVPLRDDGTHDCDAMVEAAQDAAVVIVCSPNNPTGPALSRDDVRSIVGGVPSTVLVLVDEAYIDFSEDPEGRTAIPLIAQYPNLLVLRTFSKVHALAGVRIGYAIGHADMIGAIQAVSVPFGVSSIAQAAALASLDDDESVRMSAQRIVAERDRMIAELRAMGYDVPDSQANFVFVSGTGSAFVEACAAAGLVVRPFPEGIRVTVADPTTNDRLLEAARRFVRGGPTQ